MSPRRHDAGFSLVELTVVMLVLGVLAAIAIPTLLSQREKAGRAAVQSDLRNLRTAQESRGVDHDPRYTDDLSSLASDGYKPSDGVEMRVYLTDGDNAYLACGTHRNVDDWLVYDSRDGTTTPSVTACIAP